MRGKFIKPALLLSVIIIVCLLIIVMSASAATSVDYIASLNTTTSFTYSHSGATGASVPCSTDTSSTGQNSYSAQPFYVDADGAYTMSANLNFVTDTVALLYMGAFDPADYSQNCQIFADDVGLLGSESITANLTANTQYYFVTSLCCGDHTTTLGNYDIDNRIAGAGNITLGLVPPPTTPTVSTPPIIPSDGRLNPRLGDIDVVIYPGRDRTGNNTMHIYCVNQLTAEGYIAMVITPDDLPTSAVSENTLLRESDQCEGGVEFYALAAGGRYAYQVNVGPNIEGTVYEYLFNNLNGADLIMRTFNLYELGE